MLEIALSLKKIADIERGDRRSLHAWAQNKLQTISEILLIFLPFSAVVIGIKKTNSGSRLMECVPSLDNVCVIWLSKM